MLAHVNSRWIVLLLLTARVGAASDVFKRCTLPRLGMRGGAGYKPLSSAGRASSGLGSSPQRAPISGWSKSFPARTESYTQPPAYVTEIEGDDQGERVVSDLSQKDSRLGFVRKVFGILSVQLLFTFGMVLLAQLNKPWMVSLLSSGLATPIYYCLFGLAMVSTLFMELRPDINPMLPLLFFTLAESGMVSIFASMFKPMSVLVTTLQTAVATGGLALYSVSRPNMDMDVMGSILGTVGAILFTGIVMGWLGLPINDVLLSSVSTLLFSGFIVYDVRRICNGDHPGHTFQSNEYCRGAMHIYLDIIGLFINLLKLQGETES